MEESSEPTTIRMESGPNVTYVGSKQYCNFHFALTNVSYTIEGYPGVAKINLEPCHGGFADVGEGVNVALRLLQLDGVNLDYGNNDPLRSNGGVMTVGTGSVLTATNVTFSNNYVPEAGGALYLSEADSHVMLDKCTFQGNTAHNGGAVFITGGHNGNVQFTDCTFLANEASGEGGAIYSLGETSTVAISGGNFRQNYAAANGGAIVVGIDAGILVDGACFSGNMAMIGGPAVLVMGSMVYKDFEQKCGGFSVAGMMVSGPSATLDFDDVTETLDAGSISAYRGGTVTVRTNINVNQLQLVGGTVVCSSNTGVIQLNAVDIVMSGVSNYTTNTLKNCVLEVSGTNSVIQSDTTLVFDEEIGSVVPLDTPFLFATENANIVIERDAAIATLPPSTNNREIMENQGLLRFNAHDVINGGFVSSQGLLNVWLGNEFEPIHVKGEMNIHSASELAIEVGALFDLPEDGWVTVFEWDSYEGEFGEIYVLDTRSSLVVVDAYYYSDRLSVLIKESHRADGGLGGGAIFGITIAVLVAIVLLVAFGHWAYERHYRPRTDEEAPILPPVEHDVIDVNDEEQRTAGTARYYSTNPADTKADDEGLLLESPHDENLHAL